MTELAPDQVGERRIVTTEELQALLATGYRVELPQVHLSEDAQQHYEAGELAHLDVPATENEILSVEYVGEEEVQCIRVADDRHLYVTDDFIPTHNTSNIVFLKSTDDSMLDTLEKMSGTTHKSRINSKSISQDLDKIVGGQTEGRVQYTMSTEKEPLISYNDMAFIPERNSIVFRAGDAPVWNRNETIMPMSWRLLKDKIVHPGHEYTLQTIPTMSSALEFDVRKNQPDFRKMLERRMDQAIHAEDAKHTYQEAYGYKDIDIARLDPDVYSDEVMGIIDLMTAGAQAIDDDGVIVVDPDEREASMIWDEESYMEDHDVAIERSKAEAVDVELQRLRYAEGTISREMLTTREGNAKVKALTIEIGEAYKAVQQEMERDREHFSVGGDGELRSADGQYTYISTEHSAAHAEALRRLNASVADKNSRVFAEDDLTKEDLEALSTVTVHAAFYKFLASLENWDGLAGGHFDRAMAVEMNRG